MHAFLSIKEKSRIALFLISLGFMPTQFAVYCFWKIKSLFSIFFAYVVVHDFKVLDFSQGFPACFF